MAPKAYELVLYGATGIFARKALTSGYTGKLAARYIVQNCPTTLKWAVGGRSPSKLSQVVDDIKPLNANRTPPGIIVADADDLLSLRSLAASTKVVISVAGPFAKFLLQLSADCRFGSKLVQACAENGTHYADITGETPWYALKILL